MAKIKMSPEQLEAVDVLQEDVTDMAVKLGWESVGPRGVNPTFAFDVYEHPDAASQMKAMVPVDPDGATTFIMGAVKVTGKVAVMIFNSPSLDAGELMAAAKGKVAKLKRKVKPASAAHSAAHPEVTVPPTDAAHNDDAGDTVPPIQPESAAHTKKVKAATAKHVKQIQAQPHQPGSIDEDAIEEAVRDLISDSWSHFASPLTDAQILKKATNGWVFWRNRLSNRTDSALVSASINSPPYITGAVIDDVDMRCLHFMQTGGGFRAVAVKRIESIK